MGQHSMTCKPRFAHSLTNAFKNLTIGIQHRILHNLYNIIMGLLLWCKVKVACECTNLSSWYACKELFILANSACKALIFDSAKLISSEAWSLVLWSRVAPTSFLEPWRMWSSLPISSFSVVLRACNWERSVFTSPMELWRGRERRREEREGERVRERERRWGERQN